MGGSFGTAPNPVESAMETNDHDPRISILIVDDNSKNLLTLRTVLEEPDLELISVTSGSQALRELLARTFAVILLDINMPGMDGFETAELIRQRRDCENTPIIFITAYGDELFVERGYRLGAVDFILTPIVPDVLRSKVGVFVRLHRQTEEIRRQSARLRQRASQLSALANKLTQAEYGERRRLAQFLHDELQQLLVAAKLRLGHIHDTQPGISEELEGVSDILDESIAASRSLTVQLSPPVLQGSGGLVKAIEWLADRFKTVHDLNVEVEVKGTCPDLPDHLRAFLYEAVRELLFNVVKHAGVSKAWVRIDCETNCLRIAVKDLGAGLDTERRRLEQARQENFGLHSIQERLECFDGEMRIQSNGRGTEIELIAPVLEELAAAPADEPDPASAVPPVAEPQLLRDALNATASDGVIRVILADDHEMLRKGLVALLANKPDIHVIGEAIDGEHVVRLASELRPDVIVMDVTMPRLNGVQATRRVMEMMPAVQVIGLSMHDSDNMADAMLDAGAVSYLNKAGDPYQLLTAIRATRSTGTV